MPLLTSMPSTPPRLANRMWWRATAPPARSCCLPSHAFLMLINNCCAPAVATGRGGGRRHHQCDCAVRRAAEEEPGAAGEGGELILTNLAGELQLSACTFAQQCCTATARQGMPSPLACTPADMLPNWSPQVHPTVISDAFGRAAEKAVEVRLLGAVQHGARAAASGFCHLSTRCCVGYALHCPAPRSQLRMPASEQDTMCHHSSFRPFCRHWPAQLSSQCSLADPDRISHPGVD